MNGDIVVGSRLRMFRTEIIKESAETVSSNIGIGRSTYTKIENGEIKIDVPKLNQLHDVYNLNPNWLILGKGSPEYKEQKDSHVNTFGDHTEMTNIIGDIKDQGIGVLKDPGNNYEAYESTTELKWEIEALAKERDMFKMLFEKNEELLSFYKSQSKK